MNWWDGRMVAVDVETTSPDPEDARIVTACVVAVGGGQTPDALTLLADPGVPIPDEAAAIHGVTTEQAQREGTPARSVITALLEVLVVYAASYPIVAFNARFDLTVLDREARRHGLEPLSERVDLQVVDPLVIDRHLDRYRSKQLASRSLEDCCRVWNVVLDGAHDAAFDAVAAARLAYRLVKDGRVIRRVRGEQERREFLELSLEWERVRHDLPALVEWQQRIAWADAEQLQAYFRGGDPHKGMPAQPDRVVPREWPVVPARACGSQTVVQALRQAIKGRVR